MRSVVSLVLFAFAGGLVAGAQTPSAPELAARIQAHYATVHDFTAGFTLEEKSPLTLKTANERGDVKVKKPGRMRWTWATGDKKVFVADGVQLYSVFPKDKYVTITPLPKGSEASTALLFLTGRGDLTKDFTPSLPQTQPAGEWEVALQPKVREADFKTLTIQVDRASWQLRGFVVVDDQGGSSAFRFLNLRENQGIDDHEFAFTPPKGMEIR